MLGSLVLVLTLGSHHFRQLTPLEELNPGVGVSYSLSPLQRLETGVYRNSYRHTTTYVTYNLESRARLAAGVSIGIVTGYRWAPVMPLAFPYLVARVSRRLSLQVSVLPTTHPIVGLQLRLQNR